MAFLFVCEGVVDVDMFRHRHVVGTECFHWACVSVGQRHVLAGAEMLPARSGVQDERVIAESGCAAA